MLTIDGARGEGGGQIVRSSLALSLVTGQAVTIRNLRARRKRPGLMRQHLTAVQAAQRVCGARVTGAAIGSLQLVFEPGEVQSGDYHFQIGTAGSTTLVLQTVLPALMLAGGVSTVALEGGTHNPLAPPFEFLARAYLPLLARLGPRVEVRLERPGFYPAGGGRFSATIHPCQRLQPLELLDRGEIVGRHVRAVVARLPRHIAERECRTIEDCSGWPSACFEIDETEDSPGPGNVVMIEIAAQHVTELFSGFGELGVRYWSRDLGFNPISTGDGSYGILDHDQGLVEHRRHQGQDRRSGADHSRRTEPDRRQGGAHLQKRQGSPQRHVQGGVRAQVQEGRRGEDRNDHAR
jgi:RNA 3'-terminal phosphate cyclase (ATP)